MENKNCKLNLSFVTVDHVARLLTGLKNSRSVAVDGVDNYGVKLADPLIEKPLHHIIVTAQQQPQPQQQNNNNCSWVETK